MRADFPFGVISRLRRPGRPVLRACHHLREENSSADKREAGEISVKVQNHSSLLCCLRTSFKQDLNHAHRVATTSQP